MNQIKPIIRLMTPEETRTTRLMNAGSVIELEGTTIYEDYYPPDDTCLKCKLGTIKIVTSGGYVLSTKIVDNPVEAVDMFHKCHMESGVLSVCILNKHGT